MNEAEIQIERVGLEGQGVGYDASGNIYFVPRALPGDRVRVRYNEDEKRYRDAKIIEHLTLSEARKEPACRYFQLCGGCDWLDWEYAAQVAAKEAILRHVIERTPFRPKEWLPFLGSKQIYGYRNRIQLKREGKEVGYYQRNSHRLVSIESCAIAHSALNDQIAILREQTAPSYSKVELTVDEGGNVSKAFDSPHGSAGFCQVNPVQNAVLRSLVKDRIQKAQSKKVVELFCGDGNLTFAYQSDVEQVIAADASEPAIEKAVELATSQNLSHVKFLRSPVGFSLTRKIAQEGGEAYDTLLLDPPRVGVGKPLEFFIQPKLKNIIYISCSPVSFSKDVVNLKRYQFVLEDVQGIDMFPHTRHIELIARFSR